MKYLNQKLLEIKKAVNDALEYCYKFVSDYNKANPEGKLKIKNKWLKKVRVKIHGKFLQLVIQIVKFQKLIKLEKKQKLLKKPDSTSKKKKIATIKT